jgi:hypothetical protein
VSITQDMMGGEWEQQVRSMRITWDVLSRTSNMGTRLHALAGVAARADRANDKAMLEGLAREANKLHAEVERYVDRVMDLDREIGLFAAMVLRARDSAPEYQPETETLSQADYDALGIDRLGALYGIPKPKNRRSS